ncbi:MAG: sulfurtransferase-like selenium metabolism protein YedF [Halanaerobiales bacterium]
MKTIDCRGLNCPQPVIKTRQALKEYKQITVVVDNKIAARNVEKMSAKMNCSSHIDQDGGDYKVVINKKENIDDDSGAEGDKIYLITGNKLGQGSAELGDILMNGFIYSLLEIEPLPEKIIFINSGVKIPTLNQDASKNLKKIEERGVDILVCGTCLDYYKLKDELAVGNISNMYEIVETLNNGDVITI